jgi:hypothetical protein
LACGGDRGIKESNPDLGARKQASKYSYRDGDRKEASVQSPASPLACWEWEGHTADFFFILVSFLKKITFTERLISCFGSFTWHIGCSVQPTQLGIIVYDAEVSSGNSIKG